MNVEVDEEKTFEMEEQFILRLPLKQANVIKKSLKLKAKKFSKILKISLSEDNRRGTVLVEKNQLHAKVVDLPCSIDSNKTTDNSLIYKTANVSQMMICQEQKFVDENEYSYAHGITPPLKNVKKRRFRKVLRNDENFEDIAEIEKEIRVRFRRETTVVSERALFGETITDSDTE
ncbi:hypothetical protein FQR65_LT10772 [Abscondita terminalis]|nr:hypothetical protein FQR65_LT10772 [Abscondita terminalis]